MKKILLFISIFFLSIALVACGGSNNNNDNPDKPEQKTYELTISDAQKDGITLKVDEEVKIDATATNGATIEFKVNDSNIATITNGTIKGVSEGNCIVTVSLKEDTTKVKLIQVKVEKKEEHVDPPTPITYTLTLSGTNTVEVGAKVTLTPALEPALLGCSYIWTVDNDKVAKVDNGEVTGVKIGTAVITCELVRDAGEDKVSATFTINVVSPTVTKVAVSGKSSIAAGESTTLEYALDPKAAQATITWSSEDATIATVDETGKVTAVKAGTTNIVCTATQADKSVEVSSKFAITVTAPNPTDVSLDKTEGTLAIAGELQLTATVSPAGSNETKKWVSSNERVATVDANGKVVAVAAGNATIYCYTANEKVFATAKITVDVAATSYIVYGFANMVVGQTEKFEAMSLPAQSNKGITWSSSDPTVLKVAADGTVQALKAGSATVIAGNADSTIKGEFAVTVAEPTMLDKVVVIDPSATSLKDGDKMNIEGTEYTFGTNLFASLAAANLQTGTKVILMAGDYLDYTISASGLYFTACVDNKAVINGKWTLADGVSNIIFDGFYGGSAGQIFGTSNNSNIYIMNMIFDGANIEAAQGTIYFDKNAYNVKVQNCQFINTKSCRSVRFEGVMTNFEVSGCVFNGTGNFDYIRSANSYPQGIVKINNNTFTNSSQSGIMFNHMGEVYLEANGNEFYNINNTCVDLRTTDGNKCTSYYEISYNIFDNSAIGNTDNIWGCIRLRFNDFTNDTLKVNCNYNKFIDWNDGVNKNVLDDATTNSDEFKLINFDNNYFTSEEVTQETFADCAVSYSSISASAVEKAISLYKIDSTGNNVKLVGVNNFGYTKNVYATLAAALADAEEDDIIYLLPGTYAEDVTISVNDLTIRTFLYAESPLTFEGNANLVTYTGKITLAKELKNFTIDGVYFAGQAQILNNLGEVGTAQATATNLDGFNFINNYVKSELTSGKGFIYFVEASSSYSHNLDFSGNYFDGSANFSAEAMVYIDNCYDIMVANNAFYQIKTKAFYVNDTTKGLSGQYDAFVSNTFESCGNGFFINWLSALPLNTETAEVYFMNNTFSNITNSAMYFGCMNNADVYKFFKLEYNKFINVGTGIHFDRVSEKAAIDCWYNEFYTVPTKAYYETVSKTKNTTYMTSLDARYNLFMDGNAIITPDSAKFLIEEDNPINIEGAVDDLEFVYQFEEYATDMIVMDEEELFAGEEKEINVLFDPSSEVFYKEIIWEVEDESILTIKGFTCTPIKSGTTKVTAIYAKNPSIKCTATFTVKEYNVLELRYEGNGILKAGDKLTVAATLENAGESTTVEWSTSDANIATVDDKGVVTAVGKGIATITCKIVGAAKTATVGVTVVDSTLENELLKLLVENNNGVVMYELINYIGYESGCEALPHNVYGSANNYYAATLPEITKNMLPTTAKNIDWNNTRTAEDIMLITVHDTGSASSSSTAWANSKWCTNTTNDNTSWHYTIGNDGIYQQVDDLVSTWHAGDGSATKSGQIDTGVVATVPGVRATVTIQDGFYVVNGQLTTCAAPKGPNGETLTTEDIVDSGIVTFIGKDNHYYIGTYYNNTYKKIASYGGLSSIGIETAVNKGSDVYLTWQRTAKFVAQKLVQYNLTLDRVVFHNNLSGKNCPQTMRTAGLCDMFMEMVAAEYEVALKYADYEITFTSSNPEILDNSGRVVGNGPRETTQVNYTITVKNKTTSATASQECSVLVIGNRNAK